tara:strand:+ start:142 stop:735 length:594 start_codon:yes stop_codon:yes gene_type:complete
MPIGINGSGTITGVSVGGLPDGIVDTDMIAAAAVTAPKRGPSAILQIVQNVTTTRLSTTSTTYVASPHTVTITPVAANSKILLSFSGCVNSNGNNHRAFVDIYRSVNGATATGIAPVGSGQTVGANNNEGFVGAVRADSSRVQCPTNIVYLDSPSYSLGNSIVYTLYGRSNNSGQTIEIPATVEEDPWINMATEIAA